MTTLFFLWGFITVLVDALVPRLKEVFELEGIQAVAVQFAWFTAYLLFSIPGAYIIGKIGYKKGAILGLVLIASGALLFYPAAGFRVFGLFLFALFVMASGITFLQVAANPYIAVLGNAEGASRRLNLAQAFNSLGTTIAPILSAFFILSDKIKTSDEIKLLSDSAKETYFASEASSVQSLFVGLAIFTFAMAGGFAMIKLPKIISDQDNGRMFEGFGKALQDKNLLYGAIGIFIYVGAEVSIGTYLPRYFVDLGLAKTISESGSLSSVVQFLSSTFTGKDLSDLDPKGIVGSFVMFYWFGAMVGRFIGSLLTSIMSPRKVLAIFGVGAVILIVVSLMSTGLTAMWSILAVGLFNSIMFPTMFTLSIGTLKDLKPQGSGILCTAIFGGAILPIITVWLIDNYSFQAGFGMLTLVYLYIAFYGWKIATPEGTDTEDKNHISKERIIGV